MSNPHAVSKSIFFARYSGMTSLRSPTLHRRKAHQCKFSKYSSDSPLSRQLASLSRMARKRPDASIDGFLWISRNTPCLKDGASRSRDASADSSTADPEYRAMKSRSFINYISSAVVYTSAQCRPVMKLHTFITKTLQHQELQNQLLQKQIELLEKSQEYRCCPANEEEED